MRPPGRGVVPAVGAGICVLLSTGVALGVLAPLLGVVIAVGIAVVAVVLATATDRSGPCTAFFTAAALTAPFSVVPLADLFLVLAAGALLLPAAPRAGPRPPVDRLLVVGVSLLAAGGVLGGLAAPAEPLLGEDIYYVPTPMLGLPGPFAEIVRFAVSTVGLLLLVRAWGPTRRQVLGVAWAYAIGTAADVVLGRGATGYGDRLLAFNGHPVVFGFVCAVGMGCALAALRSSRTLPARAAAALLALVALLGMGASGTRSAALVVVIALALVQVGRRRLGAVVGAVGAAAAVVATVVLVPDLLGSTAVGSRLGGAGGADFSDETRGILRERAFDIVRARPFTGAGFDYLIAPHNLLLGAVAAAGVAGLVGFLAIAAGLTRRAVARAAADPAVATVIAIGAAFFLGAWVINVAWDRWLWIPLAAAFGLVPDEPARPGVGGREAVLRAHPVGGSSR